MNLYDTLTDIHALETELLIFERKYGIRSETLYAAYIEGEEPETEQFPVVRHSTITFVRVGATLARVAPFPLRIASFSEFIQSIAPLPPSAPPARYRAENHY